MLAQMKPILEHFVQDGQKLLMSSNILLMRQQHCRQLGVVCTDRGRVHIIAGILKWILILRGCWTVIIAAGYMSLSSFDSNPSLYGEPHIRLLNMWEPLIPSPMTRGVAVYTRHRYRSGSMSHIWWCLSLIHLHLQAAGCDAYPEIIVNFCVILVCHIGIKMQRVKQLVWSLECRPQVIECILNTGTLI